MTSRQLRRVLLVGFMGAGKTSVGRLLADRLGWSFADFDEAIEAEAGATVAEIFEGGGEAAFRSLEARVAGELLRRERVVLASGGGWGAVTGRLTDVPPGTETFWLEVRVEEALRRAAGQSAARPLLAVDDPLARASELLRRRVPGYREARWAVDTEGSTVEDVTARILRILAREYPEQAAHER